jgi:hypothetical protein
MTFFIKNKQDLKKIQGSIKSIHHKIQSQHSTPKNLTVDEVTAIRASTLKIKNNTPQANYRGIH